MPRPPARYGTRWSASKTGKSQSPSGYGPLRTEVRHGRPGDSHSAHGGVWRASGLALLEESPVRLWTAQWGLLIRGCACKSNVSHEHLTVLMSCGPIETTGQSSTVMTFRHATPMDCQRI